MKKYANHKLRWKGSILIALISAILLYTLATVYAEDEKESRADVSVEWQPEASEARTGETVAIRLSSYINTETAESAEVKIALTEEEASTAIEVTEDDIQIEAVGKAVDSSEAEEEPEAAEQPEAEEEPEATGQPETVEEPEVTEQPEEEPEVTEQPETEEEPEATGQPETVEEPESTEPRELF